MKITVKYGERSYGNEYDKPDFKLHVRTSQSPARDGATTLVFEFISGASGRGSDFMTSGLVEKATLELSPEHARRMAVAILAQLDSLTDRSITLAFGRAATAPSSPNA